MEEKSSSADNRSSELRTEKRKLLKEEREGDVPFFLINKEMAAGRREILREHKEDGDDDDDGETGVDRENEVIGSDLAR